MSAPLYGLVKERLRLSGWQWERLRFPGPGNKSSGPIGVVLMF